MCVHVVLREIPTTLSSEVEFVHTLISLDQFSCDLTRTCNTSVCKMNYDGSPLGYFAWCLEDCEEFRGVPYVDLRAAARKVWDDMSFQSRGQYIRAHRRCRFTGQRKRVLVHRRHRGRVLTTLRHQAEGGQAAGARERTMAYGRRRHPDRRTRARARPEPLHGALCKYVI